ncbi:hypothetical protein FTV88_0621 [Heliorestis convoluta]|uniref:Uncharacterized protein n=1 Tax=Heliorestis convoluta TaxID=356322 RepID=A0A5Q2N399_9FIRM|nr:hypothetical protein FTV88_0621 [Heliorestis convoluta]
MAGLSYFKKKQEKLYHRYYHRKVTVKNHQKLKETVEIN